MLELKFLPEFPQEIIAADEVGRGPLCGPVVIGAVRVRVESKEALKALGRYLRPKGITDSKKLTKEARERVLVKLGHTDLGFRNRGVLACKGLEVSYVTWDICVDSIDRENILAASLRGMKEAAQFLSEGKNIPTTVFIDGHQKLRWPSKAPWTEVPVIKGDSKSLLIGLASIIAKEKRDAHMKDLHELYPQYGINLHMGYPTASHREAIRQHGPSPIHRKTFKGVKEFVRAH